MIAKKGSRNTIVKYYQAVRKTTSFTIQTRDMDVCTYTYLFHIDKLELFLSALLQIAWPGETHPELLLCGPMKLNKKQINSMHESCL